MLKRILCLLFACWLLCGCTQAPAPTEPSADPTVSTPAVESEGDTQPTAPTTEEERYAAMLEPQLLDSLKEHGFSYLRALNLPQYLYLGDLPSDGAAEIFIPGMGLTLNIPQELFDQLYIVVIPDGILPNSIGRVRVLDRSFVSLYSVWECRDRTEWIVNDPGKLITGGEAWDIYLFEIRTATKDAFAASLVDQPEQKDMILAETDQYVYYYHTQRNDFGADSTQDDMARLVARRQLGEALYDAMGGNWRIALDEVKAMITLDPDAP